MKTNAQQYVLDKKESIMHGVKRLFRGMDLMGGRQLVAVPCREVDVSSTPAEVVVVPWGEVIRTDGGRFVLDADSGQKCVNAFRARGTDLVIDYDHQTLGGEYSAPDGKSPAAGWIKSLAAVPARGLVASVEWTARAQETIANKEYRYLSPVVLVNPDTHHAERLHNCALTNIPAITNMPALVNSDGSEPGGSDPSVTEESGMDYKAILLRLLGLPGTATDADIEQAAQAQPGGEPVVNAMRLALDKSRTLLADGEQRIRELQGKLNKAEIDLIIFRNSDKIPPAQEEAFREMYAVDKKVAIKWLDSISPLVATAKTYRPMVNSDSGDRRSIITSARAEFRSNKADGGVLVCSERAFINMKLRDAKLSVMDQAEVRTFQVAID